jgi:hypothetical protein
MSKKIDIILLILHCICVFCFGGLALLNEEMLLKVLYLITTVCWSILIGMDIGNIKKH